MERQIRNAAKALLIKDEKMLAVKISDGKEEWYIMSGADKMQKNFYRRRPAGKLLKKWEILHCRKIRIRWDMTGLIYNH